MKRYEQDREEKAEDFKNPEPEIVEVISTDEVERRVQEAKDKTMQIVESGKYKQKGNVLKMKIGNHEIGYYLKPGVLMIGVDEGGKPIFKNVLKGMR
jgi:hypothetical protein